MATELERLEERLEFELKDAHYGEGNSSRISFEDWLRAMADNDRGILQGAARDLLAIKALPELRAACAGLVAAASGVLRTNGLCNTEGGESNQRLLAHNFGCLATEVEAARKLIKAGVP